jgi:hypothetical protein
MWEFFGWLFFFRGRPLPKIVRVVFAGLAIGLLIVVVLYTANMFLTLDERTGLHHVHSNSAH